MNEQGKHTAALLRRVWETLGSNHVLSCGTPECALCALWEELGTQIAQDEARWKRELAADAELLKRQTEDEQRREYNSE